LDDQAVKGVSQWRFEPAKRDGKPVPVLIEIETNFRLH
jgi:outer membrane biosynthesis protein TonB